jgi:cytochrome c oxidase subunit 4
MSDVTETLPVPAEDRGALAPHTDPLLSGEEHAHPEPRQYVLIAVILVIVTAIEVAASYIDQKTIGPNWIILILATGAIIKFTLVVSWYMHLRFDARALRRFFLVGLFGALTLYLIVALMMHAFLTSYNHVTP